MGGLKMDKYIIAICDDELYYREYLFKLLKEYKDKKCIKIKVDQFDSGESLIEMMNIKSYDIILLDVEMKELTGVDTANQIKKLGKKPQIIFVTSHEDYALDAINVDAIGYLLKPVSYENLEERLDKAIYMTGLIRAENKSKELYISIKENKTDKKILLNEIQYIEKIGNQCNVNLGDKEYFCYDTLLAFYEKLPKDIFIYCHQGYIVNLNYITDVMSSELLINNSKSLPISRKYKKEVRERFLTYLDSM